MTKIPENVIEAWKNREGFPVFTTVDDNGVPNAIYVGILDMYDDETIVIGNNFFNKTLANIQGGSKAALLFLSSDKKSYQVKGNIEYATSGPLFDFMKSITPDHLPGHAAAAIRVETVYSGAEQLA